MFSLYLNHNHQQRQHIVIRLQTRTYTLIHDVFYYYHHRICTRYHKSIEYYSEHVTEHYYTTLFRNRKFGPSNTRHNFITNEKEELWFEHDNNLFKTVSTFYCSNNITLESKNIWTCCEPCIQNIKYDITGKIISSTYRDNDNNSNGNGNDDDNEDVRISLFVGNIGCLFLGSMFYLIRSYFL